MSSRQAVLVAVQTAGVSLQEFDASVDELHRLVTTLGYAPSARITQARAHIERNAVLGEGKLEELCDLTHGSGKTRKTIERKKTKAELKRESPDAAEEAPRAPSDYALVAVDHDLTPSQLRNLERATGVQVLDRTGVIIEIFHRHAKSREARLQVEIARLKYTAPRQRESQERQQGRGAGESALELDRRRIRDRLSELREELAAVQREQGVRRSNRQQARRVALIGYTNAGKSSLLRGLTGSEVYVENKLFATLDTTVRTLMPEAKPRILVSDTVGFIKKLPHDLVASFKSTLDEALEASHLLHVVDASDPHWESQLKVTHDVLAEIGAGHVPTTLVMNKVDQVEPNALKELRERFPDAWFLSAHKPEDVADLRERIIGLFEAVYDEATLVVPYAKQGLLNEMHELGVVLDTRYEPEGVVVTFRAEKRTIDRIKEKMAL